MATRDWIEVSASMVGGAAVGAALMYLLDPDRGAARRGNLGQMAGGTLAAAGESAQAVADSARSRARQMFADEDTLTSGGLLFTSSGICAALAVGAGLMYLFDPSLGRDRRSILTGSAGSAARTATRYASQAGRYVGGAAQRATQKVQEAVETGTRYVASAGGRIGEHLREQENEP